MHIDTLRVFCDLADSRSFSKTAEHHLLSQSAVSQQLAQLELTHKCQLITRKKRPIELTAAGTGYTKVSVRTEASLLQQNPQDFPGVRQQAEKEDYVIYYSVDPGPTVSAIIEAIQTQGDTLIDLRVERPSLEERFLELTTL